VLVVLVLVVELVDVEVVVDGGIVVVLLVDDVDVLVVEVLLVEVVDVLVVVVGAVVVVLVVVVIPEIAILTELLQLPNDVITITVARLSTETIIPFTNSSLVTKNGDTLPKLEVS
jgi:hypothetical protein